MAKKPTPEETPVPQAFDHGPGPFIEGALPRVVGDTVTVNTSDDGEAEILPADGLHPVEIANGRSAVALYEGTASCATCRFAARDSANALQCRRYPPVRGSGERFPSGLNIRDWCGEYSEGARL